MSRQKNSGKALTSTAVKLKESDSIVSDKHAETPQPQDIQALETASQKQNKFASFQEFKTFVKTKFIEGSGIAPELFAECIEFHTDLEVSAGNDAEYPIHELLNWKPPTIYGHQARETIYAAMFKNEDGSIWQGIISWWDEKSKRPYQYLAPTKNGDRVFLPPVPNSIRRKIGSRYGVEVPEEGSFWQWLKDATQVETSPLGSAGNFTAYSAKLVPLKIPRIVTEGGKKGLALLTQGYIPLSLYGCTCGGRSGLIPDLRQFNQEGSIWLLAFDRDSKEETKRKVNAAKRKLEKVLAKDGFKNYIEDIVWSSEDGKGVDDLIVNKGFGAFDTVYSRALGRLEKQFSATASGTADEPEKHKNAPPDQMAKKIAEDYRGKLAFNDETKQWMRYGDDLNRSLEDLPFGIWSPESNEYMEAIVYKILSAEGAFAFGADYVSSVVKLLRHELIERRWNEVSPREYLPFTNGVVEIATGKLLPHTPGYKLTWSLPREYSPDGGSWDNISNFLEHLSNGNADIKELLICYCNAVIKGRYDLQKFIHLIGLGGTGKGTFTRLVTELIGDQNVLVTNLPAWCTNQFEGANAFGKRLVIFPDEDPYRGSIGRFLSLTGEDKVRAEEKGKRAFNFDYQGMTLVCSNFPVFSGGSSSRAKRRTITVPCNKIVPENQRKQLSKVFEPELAAFTNYLLSLSDDHVTSVLKGEKEIPQCTLEFWENQMKGDSVAAWLNEKVVYDPMATTAIGNDRNEGANGAEVYTLFGSYVRHCLASGDSPKSSKVFSPDLIETCHTILNWPVVKKATETGKFIKGLRLRHSGIDNHIPTYDYYLMQRVTQADGSPDGSPDGSQSLLAKETDGSDGLKPTLLREEPTQTEFANNSVQNQPTAADDVSVNQQTESDRTAPIMNPNSTYEVWRNGEWIRGSCKPSPVCDQGSGEYRFYPAGSDDYFCFNSGVASWREVSTSGDGTSEIKHYFSEGETVEIIADSDGKRPDWVGAIEKIICCAKGNDEFIQNSMVLLTNNKSVRYSDIRLVTDAKPSDRTSDAASDIKVGDTVWFNREVTLGDIDPNAKHPANLIANAGESAEVVRVLGSTLHLLIAGVEIQCPVHWTGTSNGTTTMTQYGQGDKVKIINPNSLRFGQEDEITAIYSLAQEVKLKSAERVPFSWIEITQKAQPANQETTKPTEYVPPPGIPLFQEGGIYYHRAWGTKVKIQKLFVSTKTAEVLKPGEASKFKVELSELCLHHKSPRSELAIGSAVQLLEGRNKGKTGTVKYLQDDGIWVLPIGGKGIPVARGPFFAHELRKV